MTIKSTIKLSIVLFSLFGSIATAQNISKEELESIRKSFVLDSQTKAIQNAVTENANIKSMVLNRDIQGKIDHFFKYRVDVKGITNQKSSGRCWMFTSMNVLRPSIMKKYNITNFDFSHNYLFFWDMFEKSNLFLENIIKTSNETFDDRTVVELFKSPVGDGGVWNLYYNAAEKYGVVPKEVMPETAHSDNTGQMRGILNEFLRAEAYKLREMMANKTNPNKLKDAKTETMKGVYRILAICLGEPPIEFTWRYKDKDGAIKELKNYTPQQFYKEITPEDYSPENYIMIMNDPTREYYKVYEIQNYRNTIEGVNWVYLNLPNEDIKNAALASIKNNEAMYTSCDVGKQFNSKEGISTPDMYDYESLFGVKLSMDKKARILTRQSGSAHAMLLIACDTDENDKPIKWEFENSWGPTSGHNGYITFTDKWFDEYMFRIVIHRNYLDTKALNSLKQEPIQLPMWDYMN